MLLKIIILIFCVLIVSRLFFVNKFRKMGKSIDRLINTLIIAIGIVLVLQVIYLYFIL